MVRTDGERARRSGKTGVVACVAILLLTPGTPPRAAATAAAPVDLEEIIVVATKTEQPLWRVAGQVTALRRDQLDWQQVQELGGLARYLPAVEADFSGTRFGSTGLSIRGIGGNRVALELDGVPLPQRFGVGSFADSARTVLDPAIIQRTEILRGPASALYGSDAIGGVIAITTVDAWDLVGDGAAFHAGGGAGYFGSSDSVLGRATLAWAGAADGLLLSVNHRSGGAPDNQARGVESDRIDYDQWQLFGKWTHNFAGGASARISLDYFDRASDSDLRSVLGYERFASTSALSGDDEQVRHRVSVELRAPELDWLQFASLMVYRQDNRTGQRTNQYRRSRGVPVFLQRDFDLRETSWGGEAKLRHGFAFGTVEHTVVAGLEWDARELTEQRDALQTSLVDGSSTNTVLGETFPLRDLPRSRSDRLGVYLQDEIELGRLTLIPAVRWDRFTLDAATDGIASAPGRVTDLDSDDVSLRIGLTWRASDVLSLYGHYAEGFRAPPAEDVNLLLDIPLFNIRAIPNPDLAPERLRNLEAGFRFARGGSALSLGAYYSKYDDFIESRTRVGTDPDTGALLFQSRNLAEATIAGLEAEASQHLGAWHPLLGDWLVTGGVHWAGGENDVTGAPLNEVSPLKAVLALQWQPEAGSLAAELRATHLGGKGGVDESGGAFFVAPSATVIDLTLRWQPTARSQVHLGVYNLTDRRYWRYPDTRQLAPDDPRIEVLSRPGTNVALTLDIGF